MEVESRNREQKNRKMGSVLLSISAPLILTVITAVAVLTLTHHLLYAQEKVIKIDGSSTVYLITEAVAEEFQKKFRDIKVTVGISGTGGGFKKFCRGEIDISDASRPIKKSEIELCEQNKIEYIELPVAYDAMAVVVNPQNNWVDYLTVEELKKMWEPSAQGKVMKWSDIRPNWPDAPLRLFGPGTDSGTYDYFTEAIVGKSGASRGDYVASEDDNVLVQGVAKEKYALGYFGVAYYFENKDILKAVPIVNPITKKPVVPSEETVYKGEYVPLSRPLFIYVNVKSLDKKFVVDFVEFYIKNAAKLSKEVGYIPLPQKVYDVAYERFKRRIKGTLFGGESRYIKIEDLMKLEEKGSR
ncbi:Phosphate-binding protein PstS [bacterium HR19]|nr:Phosphate-binding protein PstS [bacterium HR19]